MYRCPLFNTHHAPVGAWASLTFGDPQTGVSFDLQDPAVKNDGILLAGCASSKGLRSIGFLEMPKTGGAELTAEGGAELSKAKAMRDLYGVVEDGEITRTLTPSKDTFCAGNIRFTTYTPYDALPDPKNGPIPMDTCLPGILMDVTVDNTAGEEACVAFLGVKLNVAKRAYSMQTGDLITFAFRNDWTFAAKASEGVFMTRGGKALASFRTEAYEIHQNGPAFFCTRVPAGQVRTLTVCWSVCAHEGSCGRKKTGYYYNRWFSDPLQAAQAILDGAHTLRERAERVDAELLRTGQQPARVALFCQAVRAYYASTQLLEDETGKVCWNVSEGGYLWRNTMDLCADHIVWELRRNPWVVRELMDEFISTYSYTDRVCFDGLPGDYPGGISFTHDMGCYFHYSRPGYSDYERFNDSEKGFYFYMTTEELLNGIYCMAGYCLHTGDMGWLKGHADLLPRLMDSLENRDAPFPEQRNGILKAATTRGGACGLESTTYDALDHSLLKAAGNLYVFIKTWCSLVLLKKLCAMVGDGETESRAEAMRLKCIASAEVFHTDSQPWLRANAYDPIPGAVSAAAEPLAIPHMLGVLSETLEPELVQLLRSHSIACLQKGVCLDAVSGGLRLSSTSRNTWPSKSVLTVYAMERVLGLTMPEGMVQEIVGWAQVSAREVTICDQILCDTREAVGAPYYPRVVTAALWL